MRFDRRILFSLLMAAMLLAAACGDDDDDGGGGDSFDDETPLVIARGMDLSTLDPGRAYCDTCQIYLSSVYETVLRLDAADNESLIPGLAETWEGSDDALTYTFNLDPDATFADGSPVEASDVKWSWERLGGLQDSPAYFVANVASIETPDPRTVVVTMSTPDTSFLAVTTSPYMVITNQEVAEANGAVSGPGAAESDSATEWFNSNSAGSGPYVLVSYAEDNELRLARNENYWSTLPNIKNIVIRHTVEAVAQRQLLETGDADIAMQLTPDLVEGIGGSVVSEEVASFNFVYIAVWPGTGLNTDVDLNQDIRHAIRYAINYDAVINATLAGAGRVQAAPIPNGFSGTETLPLPERDLDMARALLASGGYPDGFELDVVFPTFNVYGVDFSTMFQQLAIDLAEVGITLNLEPADPSVWIDRAFDTGLPMTAIYFAPDHTDSSQYVQYFGMVPGAFWQGLIGVMNDQEAMLLQEALATADEDAKAEIYEQIGLLMIDEAYILPIVNPNLILARSESVQGMHYSACCNLELWRLSRD